MAEQDAAPAGRARNPALGRPGAPPGGYYGPPAESRLIREVRSLSGKRGPGSKGSRGGAPRGAPASVIGRLISGEPEIGPTARRATGAAFRAQRLSALCPPLRGAHGRRRTPRRKEQGRRSIGFFLHLPRLRGRSRA